MARKLRDLILQDRPDLQRGERPHAKVLASCSRRTEEPAFLARDRRYFGKDRGVYGWQIGRRIFHLRNVGLFDQYLQDALLEVAGEKVQRQETDTHSPPHQ